MRHPVDSLPELEARWARIRAAAREIGADAVLVCGNEYSGFEGSVRYVTGFRIVHRYAYGLIPTDESEPVVAVHPREARWVGDIREYQVECELADRPGEWIGEQARARGWKKLAVYGLDYIMCVRDYTALAASGVELIGFDYEFDLARMVKSPAEIASVRESVALNAAGVWAVVGAYEPGVTTEADLMAEAERCFVAGGAGRWTMDMVLRGTDGDARPEFTFPRTDRPIEPDEMLLYSLEIAAPGGHWVEVSRPLCAAGPSKQTGEMLEAYEEYFAAARRLMRPGSTAHDVNAAVSEPFRRRGFGLGHVTGHSIGMTMIEFPKIGEGFEVELQENMVISMHPHALSPDQDACLYMQDTWLVTADGGEPIDALPLRVFDGSERP